jgi:hypothetical protein
VLLQELAKRLADGEEGIYEGLPDVAAAAAGSLSSGSIPAVQLLVVDAKAAALPLM